MLRSFQQPAPLPMTNTPVNLFGHSRANVLGVGIHAVDMSSAVETIAKAVTNRTKGYVCATGVHGVMEAQRDSSLRKIFSKALLVVPDGMPTVWMGRLQGLRAMRRVFGPDLMLAAFGAIALRDCSHFLYGGPPGVAQQLEANLRQRFPNAQIVGTYTPPFRPLNEAESADLCEVLDHLRPDVVWVGLSTPKQERFMAEYLPRLNTTLMIGVGAAFDFHTGRLNDSPQWVKQSGLQWLHRLCQEPARLWRRYLLNNPLFLAQAALQLTGIRRFDLWPEEQAKATTLPNITRGHIG
jgi:N-acetylglucosaminyldiphosphoundecaprenol N-acetyl-beta-D-mannosaminyltransferase